MSTMYELTQQMTQIVTLLEEDELTQELEEKLQITQDEINEKSVIYAKVINSLAWETEAIDSEIRRLQVRKKKNEKNIQSMKDAMFNAMKLSGIEKISSPLFTISVRRSEAVEIVNLEQLPEMLRRTKVSIEADKTKIKEAIKSGLSVNGARIVENFSINIK